MSLSIKEIEISDSPFITNLTIQLGYESTTQETEMRLNKILSDDEHCAYAAMDEGKLIGWIHAFYVINLESESFVEIGGMVVDEYSRGKGIGKKLIEKVEGWAIQKKM